jgi:hypothetical protein
MPAMGVPSARGPNPRVRATISAEPTILGRSDAGTPNIESSAGSHASVRRFASNVRDAFVTSVT